MKVVSISNGNPVVSESIDATLIAAIGAAGTDQSSATVVPRTTQTTVCVVHCTDPTTGVRLPSDADVGDIVELYADNPALATMLVYPPTSEQWNVA